MFIIFEVGGSERERGREKRGGAEREGDRESKAGFLVESLMWTSISGLKLTNGLILKLTNREIMT